VASSSSSSQLEEPEDEDSDPLHDMKANGAPSDNSPYAQVRASVAATDDITLSINTPRMWTLSILFAILGSSTNLFFSLRYPSVSITPIIALLLVHPLGILWDQILKRGDDPDETFINGSISREGESVDAGVYSNGECSSTVRGSQVAQSKDSWKRRLRLWLAQGRWNEKEHCCVYISSNVSFGFAFATDVSHSHAFPLRSTLLISVGHCGADQVLSSGPRCNLPDTPHSIHSNLGLCTCRSYPPVPRPTQWNDMASHISIHGHVHGIAQGAKQAR
jgi:hypothetical protein